MEAAESSQDIRPGTMSGDEFDEIRPYRDAEVADVIRRLVADRELLEAVVGFTFPRLWPLRALLAPAAGVWLRRRTRRIDSIRKFQELLEIYFARMVKASTDGFTIDGLDGLDREAHVFVSNHRDITLDSGFLNYVLWRHGYDTTRIAIGDNLLGKPYATDLMRLNKSFVVRRSISGMKAMYASHALTSRYVHHCVDEGQSVWIAQREGRAKDGMDRTEPAIIKMFHLSRRKTATLAETIEHLAIVPVSISYELDPCDRMKARELLVRAREGSYSKPDDEDMQSIVRGIVGFKGRVHLSLGKRLEGAFERPEDVAAAIDRQILGSHRIFGTHADAYRRLGGREERPWLAAAFEDYSQANRKRFAQRLEECPEEERDYVLGMYANPVMSRLALERGEI